MSISQKPDNEFAHGISWMMNKWSLGLQGRSNEKKSRNTCAADHFNDVALRLWQDDEGGHTSSSIVSQAHAVSDGEG